MLDTNVVSELLKRNLAVIRRLHEVPVTQWCISSITRSELRYGIARLSGSTRIAQLVNEFLSTARTEAWGVRAADVHGRLRAELAAMGRRIGDFDEMIAAQALALEAILVTANIRHFSRVPGLKVENWVR